MIGTMLELSTYVFFATCVVIFIYFTWSVYNEYLRTKILKKRSKKLAELEELIQINQVASKLEKKIEKRAKGIS
ncbi:hypothetical protein GCM10007063_05630 [Lentibacillus kapialis]|uniref:Uncharacterized protein n=1 Tax=Lentibacillus kapialis TaxID=340214 RepID=A0A917UU36_9BACI|nr:hypothetical protein [Lentibacillus kapialis]GGJ86016.1 hypothetical protein GCM10007063_05630 [Lentibacillus kapialis]